WTRRAHGRVGDRTRLTKRGAGAPGAGRATKAGNRGRPIMRIVLAAVAAMVMCATSGLAARAHAQEVEAAPTSDSVDVAKKTELIRRYLVATQYEKLVNAVMESMSGQLLARSQIPEE